MKSRRYRPALVLALLATSHAGLPAAAAPTARLLPRAARSQPGERDTLTTKSGIYTFQQARRGADVYAGNCRSCHTVESHTGAAFNATWNRRALADLFAYISDRMPKNDP